LYSSEIKVKLFQTTANPMHYIFAAFLFSSQEQVETCMCICFLLCVSKFVLQREAKKRGKILLTVAQKNAFGNQKKGIQSDVNNTDDFPI